MDVRLLERLREGDPAAVDEVKRQLRPFAARVLASPLWSLGAAEARQLEQEAVLAALRSTAEDGVGLVREVLSAATVLGLRALRTSEGQVSGDHPAEALLVGVALQTASLAQASQLKAHVEGCAACRRHQDHVEEALRGARRAHPTEPGASAPPGAPTPAAAPASAQQAPPAASKPPRARRPAAAPRARPPVLPLLALAALCGAFGWWQAQPSQEQRAWRRAALLPAELPPTDRAETYTGEAQAAILELRSGSCPSAAARLRLLARKSPEDRWLRWYEGLAHICARDGARALEALDAVRALPGEAPFGYDWWRAQALVLADRVDEALPLLDQLGASEHPRAPQAKVLALRLRERR